MCGIAGLFSFRASAPADAGELRAMTQALAARGPDGEGEWFSPDARVALGHRRLAIIDLSPRGAQPMASEDAGTVISFNGEIYNWRELRRELQAAGDVFRTDSDTEVLLRLYARHGEGMLSRLRGMFALALWDARKQAMLLARDAFGIKPLYWGEQGGVLRFASQVKALLATRRIDTAPQAAGHAGFFLWGSVPAPWTLYKGAHCLPAGHLMWASAKGCEPPRPYCRIEEVLAEAASAPAHGSREDALDAIAHALKDSVAAHHVADVPVGVFLSSGLDSCVIAGATARSHGRPRTITLGFAEYRGTRLDEVGLAEQWAAHLGAEHTTVTVRHENFERDRAGFMQCMDQPSIDGMNAWFVSKAAREAGLKVALSGLGGDELFATYPSFRQLPRIRNFMRPLSRVPGLGVGVRRLTGAALGRFTSAKYASLIEYGGELAGAYLLRRGLFLPWELESVMDAQLAREGLGELRTFENLRATLDGIRSERLAISALEMSWYTRHQLLADTDWASMAHSLEVRVPLLDLPLLRTTAPWLAAHPSITKREVARWLLPELPKDILERKKTGFSVPVKEWAGKPGDLRSRRGLRGWAKTVYAQSSPAPVVHLVRRVSLWSPGMTSAGGIQTYMWRLWDMLCASPEFGPARGISLMDDDATLAGSLRSAGPRPIAAARSKLRFVNAALGTQGRCDLAVVGHVHHAPVAMLALLLRNIKGYVVVLHGVEAWSKLPWPQRLALRHAEAVVATTGFTARQCAAMNGLPDTNFRVLPLCADPSPSPADPQFELAGAFPILFVGRLAKSERYKGLDTVIEAHAQLAGRGVELTLHVIGDGDDRERLQSLAASTLGVGRAFFHGRVGDAQLQAAYARAKVFVMPSAKEGFGIVFLEAMRHGVPCIGGAHGGTPEVFAQGREGLLVRYGDAATLADYLEKLARNEAFRRDIGEAGKRRVEADYSFTAFATRWQALLRQAPQASYEVSAA